MTDIVLILGSVVLVVVAQVLLKIGASSIVELDRSGPRGSLDIAWKAIRIPAVFFGLALYGLSAVLWIYVLARVPLSYAYPFLGLSYVGVIVVAVVYLKERFLLVQWVGLVLVVAGVIAVAASA